MSAIRQPVYTVEEYFALELSTDQKHEYFNGHIYAMAGASARHIFITTDTLVALGSQLKGKTCSVLSNDTRVKINSAHFVYPDLTVVCGQPHWSNEKPPSLLNPTLIIEVLSDSTEEYDRGRKFQQYQTIPSFTEYVLISQKTVHVERFYKQDNGEWVYLSLMDLQDTLEFKHVPASLALTDIYARVDFEQA
jgi:Uma2 family endonuclease